MTIVACFVVELQVLVGYTRTPHYDSHRVVHLYAKVEVSDKGLVLYPSRPPVSKEKMLAR